MKATSLYRSSFKRNVYNVGLGEVVGVGRDCLNVAAIIFCNSDDATESAVSKNKKSQYGRKSAPASHIYQKMLLVLL